MHCLSGYIGNWSVLIKVCEENHEEIDKDISAKVNNLGLKRNVEDLVKRL